MTLKRTALRSAGIRAFASTDYPIDLAVKHARTWWESVGRRIMPGHLNAIETAKLKIKTGGDAPAIVIPREFSPDLNSGILQAKAWDDLSRQEKVLVVQAWHQEHVQAPMARAGLTNPTK